MGPLKRRPRFLAASRTVPADLGAIEQRAVNCGLRFTRTFPNCLLVPILVRHSTDGPGPPISCHCANFGGERVCSCEAMVT